MHCCCLLGTGEWKVPEEVVHQIQNAFAQQWYSLVRNAVLLEPGIKNSIMNDINYAKYVDYAKYADYAYMVTSSEVSLSTSSGVLGLKIG